jgi:hypothetical protein
MTIIDYLLLGGFVAASVYTISRLFVGLRNSSTAPMRMDRTEEESQATDAHRLRPAASGTRAPWHSRKRTEKGIEL